MFDELCASVRPASSESARARAPETLDRCCDRFTGARRWVPARWLRRLAGDRCDDEFGEHHDGSDADCRRKTGYYRHDWRTARDDLNRG